VKDSSRMRVAVGVGFWGVELGITNPVGVGVGPFGVKVGSTIIVRVGVTGRDLVGVRVGVHVGVVRGVRVENGVLVLGRLVGVSVACAVPDGDGVGLIGGAVGVAVAPGVGLEVCTVGVRVGVGVGSGGNSCRISTRVSATSLRYDLYGSEVFAYSESEAMSSFGISSRPLALAKSGWLYP
jgi:hypothetical protein